MAGVLALAAFVPSSFDAYAQQQDSILKQGFKIFGFATDVAPPVDFVNKTRPAAILAIFRCFSRRPSRRGQP